MLVKVNKDENGEQLVSARELYEFLEVKRDFTTWIKARIKKYEGFIENLDFTVVSIAPQNGGAIKGGQNRVDYILKLDMAKELSMIENNAKGREARRYFIECEKKYYTLAENIRDIKFNPRLKEIQESVTTIKNLEEEIRKLQKKVSNEYKTLSRKALFMKEFIDDGEIEILNLTEFKK